ncbi:MAG: ATP-binding cassette domain-containing protein, partial [Oligoflexia bacterium]|nr:ATP-binding cassette domain-containing protein [Oligoflexia bacterium]
GVGDVEPDPRAYDTLTATLTRLTGLRAAQAEAAVRLAAEPEQRPVTDVEELSAFAGRLGQAAASALADEGRQDRTLSDWARDHDLAQAVALLTALVDIAGHRGLPDGSGLRRLEDAARQLGLDDLVLADLIARRFPPEATVHNLNSDRISVGRGSNCAVYLPDPQVAPHHCDLVRTENAWRVVDAGSGRPTLVGGRIVLGAPLEPGVPLGLGPYTLTLRADGAALSVSPVPLRQVLSVRQLQRSIDETVLLDDVSFTVVSGELIAVVGPSGAGKTTLLNAITGIAAADAGIVELDGQDFHAILERDQTRVGMVPQDDIVHPELTVRESLVYSALLRLPGNTDQTLVDQAVERVLGELDIEDIARSRVGDALRRGISGGQRKRANLGQELLTRSTSILFLDEPTSGLDPRSAQDIVRLVRQLADRGRIVFIVTHDLTPQVMSLVDHLLVLVPGGRLAWFGPPRDAASYFGVPTPDAIFRRIEDRSPQDWAQAWRDSLERRRRVSSREAYLGLADDAAERSAAYSVAHGTAKASGALSHLWTLTRRYARVKTRDKTSLWVLGAQPPFLALVMALVFPEPTPELLFMLTLSCLWFGMSAAVRELIGDRAVWKRERRIGVGVLPYVGSKIGVLGLLSVMQCSFLSTALWGWFGMQDYGFSALALAALSSLVGLCGMALGLLVSAIFTSSEAAVGSLPLLLIPQITFSALLVHLRDMSPISQAVSWTDPLRYAFEAMLKVGEKIARPTRVPGKWESRSFTGPLYDYGFKTSAVGDLGTAMPVLVAVLLAFTLAFLVATVVVVWARGRAQVMRHTGRKVQP